MNGVRRILAPLLVGALAACPAAAAVVDPTNVPASPDGRARVTIPFAPPLGPVLEYRSVDEGIRGGRPYRIESSQLVSFRRVGAGYVMIVQLQNRPRNPLPRGKRAVSISLMQRMKFRLAADGAFVELLDAAAQLAGAQRAAEAMLRARPDRRDAAMARQAVAELRALPPSMQLVLLGGGLAPITGAAGEEYGLGDELTGTVRVKQVDPALEQGARLRLEAVVGGVARFSGTKAMSNEQLEAATRALARRLGPDRPAGVFRLLSSETRESYEVSLETGLALRHRIDHRSEAEQGGQRQRTATSQTLELVR
jgi:hypothetical protein